MERHLDLTKTYCKQEETARQRVREAVGLRVIVFNALSPIGLFPASEGVS